jgi:hypothetical protein
MSEPVGPTLPAPDKKPAPSTEKELDERTAVLEARIAELDEREANMRAEFEPRPERTSIDELGARTEGQNPKAVRRDMGRAKRLDADKYIEIHQDKTLMWINDMDGDVQRWLDEGAEPVPVISKATRTFEGLTDTVESKWVRSIGGDDGRGGHFWVYLLMIDPEVYQQIKIDPELERQAAIRRSIQAGVDQSKYGEGPKLPSYAPNLPTGGRGLDIQQETVE